jgi:hypothetical protein
MPIQIQVSNISTAMSDGEVQTALAAIEPQAAEGRGADLVQRTCNAYACRHYRRICAGA